MYIRRKVFSMANDYDYLSEIEERAFCEGYEYGQREFGFPGGAAKNAIANKFGKGNKDLNKCIKNWAQEATGKGILDPSHIPSNVKNPEIKAIGCKLEKYRRMGAPKKLADEEIRLGRKHMRNGGEYDMSTVKNNINPRWPKVSKEERLAAIQDAGRLI